MSEDLTLYSLARNLQQLMQLAEYEDLKPEDRASIENEVKRYVHQEVKKVDSIRAFIRLCDARIAESTNEILRIALWQNTWKRRLDNIKEITLNVMKEFVPADKDGRIRLEGGTGSLAVQKNGGKQAVQVDQPDMVPDEYCRMEGWITEDAWRRLLLASLGSRSNPNNAHPIPEKDFHFERRPNITLIAEALNQSCETCAGLGQIAVQTEENKLEPSLCGACGGDGKARVPGARFAPRSERLVVR
jgi:Gp157 protein